MSLKKKSVLGLSYLTVALLGASVLMANPVSADEEKSSDYGTITAVDPDYPKESLEVSELTEEFEEEVGTTNEFQQAQQDGWNAGYQAGKQANKPEIERTEIPSSNKYEGKSFEDDYKDSYQRGHYQGYLDAHTPAEEDDAHIPAEEDDDLGVIGTIYVAVRVAWSYISSWF